MHQYRWGGFLIPTDLGVELGLGHSFFLGIFPIITQHIFLIIKNVFMDLSLWLHLNIRLNQTGGLTFIPYLPLLILTTFLVSSNIRGFLRFLLEHPTLSMQQTWHVRVQKGLKWCKVYLGWNICLGRGAFCSLLGINNPKQHILIIWVHSFKPPGLGVAFVG